MPYECQHCRASFSNYYSLRSHVNGSVIEGIPRCALISRKRARAVITTPANIGAEPVIATPVELAHEICRRHQDDSKLGDPRPLHNLGSAAGVQYTGSVNYGALVLALRKYCDWVLQSRAQKFWLLYLATRHLPQDDQRKILELVRKLFVSKQMSKRHWCTDKRAVRYLLSKKQFWPLVTYTYTCDLTAFKVSGLGVVKYTFLDPIFAWILQARKLCKKYTLLFRYREARSKSTGQQTWGSCVSCGEAMRQVNYPGTNPRYVTQVNYPRTSRR